MHLEFLVEDSSGKALLEILIPKILGPSVNNISFRIHSYKGIGKVPKNLKPGDASNRMLLNQLPRILQGYGKTAGIDAVIVVLDSDKKDCITFLEQLKSVNEACNPKPNTMFRIAIEEIEAWYFGDPNALNIAYPKAKQQVIKNYTQDSICGTWEMLADAIYPGGSSAVKKIGWPLPGQIKHEWAQKIGPKMDVEDNKSYSFCKLRNGIRRIIIQ